MTAYELSHLRALESEAVHIMREVAAERERPVLLFSGGKDSIVMLRLAEKAFRPARFPFPVMHIDTGHNFPEATEFRDRLELNEIGCVKLRATSPLAYDPYMRNRDTGSFILIDEATNNTVAAGMLL
jgi:sulfate adenylyltransferase subunit 2